MRQPRRTGVAAEDGKGRHDRVRRQNSAVLDAAAVLEHAAPSLCVCVGGKVGSGRAGDTTTHIIVVHVNETQPWYAHAHDIVHTGTHTDGATGDANTHTHTHTHARGQDKHAERRKDGHSQ